MRVAVLDDSGDLVELLCLLVTTREAGCVGSQSLAEMQAQSEEVMKTRLAILDVNLGLDEPSGLDAYHWLARSGYTGRIVFLTGHGIAHPLVQQVRTLDGVQVLEKPVEVDEILALLDEVE